MALTRINGNLISSGTITGNLFLNNTITGNLIAPAAVTGDKIGLTAITGNLVAAAAITGDKIGLTAITGNLIASAAVTGDKIGLTAITSNLIASGVTLTSPVLITPNIGTPSSGILSSCTVDSTNKVGYLNIPNSGAKTTSYTLVAGDVGKFIELGTSGTVVVPASVFAAGDAISIFNNTSASISCTCSAVTTVYKGGTDADISSFSVATRGVATILFITATVAVITGNLA